MTTVPRTSRVREHRPRAARVPRPRKPSRHLDVTSGPRTRPGWPDEVVDAPLRESSTELPARPPIALSTAPQTGPQTGPPVAVRRRTIPEPRLLRTGAAAALGMVVMAALLGTVGGIVLLWLGTSMLQYLR